MNLSPVFRQRFFDNVTGAPLAGGMLYSYQAGTTTLQATYANAGGTANTNPVVLDVNGYADIWLDPALAYKFILTDASGNQLWSVDNVSFNIGITTWLSTETYQQGSIVQDTSGYGVFFVSLINNNIGNALTDVSAWRAYDGNTRTVSTNTTLTVGDNLVRSNSTAGNLTHTLPSIATTPAGKKLIIKDVGTGGYGTAIQGSGTDLVDGNNLYSNLLYQNQSATVRNNGTSWDVI